MLTITPGKEIRGSVKLPPNPDLFMLTSIAVVASGRAARVSPLPNSPLINRWIDLLKNRISVVNDGDSCLISAFVEVPIDTPLSLPYPLLPYAGFIVCALLGKGFTLELAQVTAQRITYWQRLLDKVKCTLIIEHLEGFTRLRIKPAECQFTLPPIDLTADELHAYIGLALGLGRPFSTELEQPFLSPLRHLLPSFGYDLSAKSTGAEKVSDPIARRILRMKKKKSDTGSVTYVVSADFSAPQLDTTPPAEAIISLPGDDVLAAALLAGKGLIQKGSLTLENVPLELWNSQTLQFVRRMGCTVGIQQTGTSTFGAVGSVQLQRFDLTGRRIECLPWFQFSSHLPAMLMLACFAEGESVFRGLDEIKLDEEEGRRPYLESLKALEVRHGEMPDGIVLKGTKHIDGFDILSDIPASFGAALAMAALRCQGTSTISDTAISLRWPTFRTMIDEICEFKESRSRA